MPWYLLAFGSALIWGFHYVMLENAMKYITPQTALFLTCLPIIIVVAVWYNDFVTDLKFIMSADLKTKAQILVITFTSLSATLLLYIAISMKTATHAALIEITYPIFVTLFTLAIFGVNHLSIGTIIGGTLILSGSLVVIWTS